MRCLGVWVVGETSYGDEGCEVNFEQYGRYFDDITRIDGEWKFTRRVFEPSTSAVAP
jgi:hypothetical protein